MKILTVNCFSVTWRAIFSFNNSSLNLYIGLAYLFSKRYLDIYCNSNNRVMYLQMFILFMFFVRTLWEVTQIVCTKFAKKAKPPTQLRSSLCSQRKLKRGRIGNIVPLQIYSMDRVRLQNELQCCSWCDRKMVIRTFLGNNTRLICTSGHEVRWEGAQGPCS